MIILGRVDLKQEMICPVQCQQLAGTDQPKHQDRHLPPLRGGQFTRTLPERRLGLLLLLPLLLLLLLSACRTLWGCSVTPVGVCWTLTRSVLSLTPQTPGRPRPARWGRPACSTPTARPQGSRRSSCGSVSGLTSSSDPSRTRSCPPPPAPSRTSPRSRAAPSLPASARLTTAMLAASPARLPFNGLN